MASTPSIRSKVCFACRSNALRISAGSLGASSRPRAFPSPRATPAFSVFRPSAALRSSPAIEERRIRDEIAGGESKEQPKDGDIEATEQDKNGEEDVPWFLQVEAPKHSTLLYEPPPLPEVPENAPKVIGPMLQFASEELGMDGIELLDLRELDPPASLGPDLIMIFGTARSERHLHISAGRLVNWLKVRGINADADGLLGRNELKTKLKRKARKEKLLGGGGGMRNNDDGISTGWICITMAALGWTPTEEAIVGPDGRMAGFGSASTGSSLVIQLMTESRREELGLERLWNGRLKQSRRDREALSGNAQTLPPGEVFRPTNPSGRRFFSTSTRRTMLAADNVLGLDKVVNMLKDKGIDKMPVMHKLLEYVDKLPPGDAIELLTPGAEGTAPASFRRVFKAVMETLAPTDALQTRLQLLVTAGKFNVSLMDLPEVAQLVDAVEKECIPMTPQQATAIVQAIFLQPAVDDTEVLQRASLVLRLVNCVFERGQDILTNELIISVIVSLLQSGTQGAETQRILASFELLLAQADLPCPSETLLLQLLNAYAQAGNWDAFWKTWRIPPKYCRPRSIAMYTYVFRRFADDGHQRRAIEALRWCVSELVNEEPPVWATLELVQALKDCVRLADPTAEPLALEGETLLSPEHLVNAHSREFVKLMRELGT